MGTAEQTLYTLIARSGPENWVRYLANTNKLPVEAQKVFVDRSAESGIVTVADTTTSPEVLEHIAQKDIEMLSSVTVLKNPNIKPQTLLYLLQHVESEILVYQAAENPQLNADGQQYILDNYPSTKTGGFLAKNPALVASTVTQLLAKNNSIITTNLIKAHHLTETQLTELVAEDIDYAVTVSLHSHLTETLLETLKKHGKEYIKLATENPNVSTVGGKIAEMLKNDPDALEQLAQNPSLPKNILCELAEKNVVEAQKQYVTNSTDLTKEWVDRALKTPSLAVSLAHNPTIDEKTCRKLIDGLDDEYSNVKYFIASGLITGGQVNDTKLLKLCVEDINLAHLAVNNPKLTGESHLYIFKNSNDAIQKIVVGGPYVSKPVLQLAAYSKSEEIRELAVTRPNIAENLLKNILFDQSDKNRQLMAIVNPTASTQDLATLKDVQPELAMRVNYEILSKNWSEVDPNTLSQALSQLGEGVGKRNLDVKSGLFWAEQLLQHELTTDTRLELLETLVATNLLVQQAYGPIIGATWSVCTDMSTAQKVRITKLAADHGIVLQPHSKKAPETTIKKPAKNIINIRQP